MIQLPKSIHDLELFSELMAKRWNAEECKNDIHTVLCGVWGNAYGKGVDDADRNPRQPEGMSK